MHFFIVFIQFFLRVELGATLRTLVITCHSYAPPFSGKTAFFWIVT